MYSGKKTASIHPWHVFSVLSFYSGDESEDFLSNMVHKHEVSQWGPISKQYFTLSFGLFFCLDNSLSFGGTNIGNWRNKVYFGKISLRTSFLSSINFFFLLLKLRRHCTSISCSHYLLLITSKHASSILALLFISISSLQQCLYSFLFVVWYRYLWVIDFWSYARRIRDGASCAFFDYILMSKELSACFRLKPTLPFKLYISVIWMAEWSPERSKC